MKLSLCPLKVWCFQLLPRRRKRRREKIFSKSRSWFLSFATFTPFPLLFGGRPSVCPPFSTESTLFSLPNRFDSNLDSGQCPSVLWIGPSYHWREVIISILGKTSVNVTWPLVTFYETVEYLKIEITSLMLTLRYMYNCTSLCPDPTNDRFKCWHRSGWNGWWVPVSQHGFWLEQAQWRIVRIGPS